VRVRVVGAGAVGSLLGLRLAAADHSVTLVGHASVVEPVRRSGLRLDGDPHGPYPVTATTTLAGGEVPDALLVTVKTFDLDAVAGALGTSGFAPVPILLPQNGLHVERAFTDRLREGGWSDAGQLVVRAVSTLPAMWAAPGVVRQPGRGELLLGDPLGAPGNARAALLFRDLLSGAGVPVRSVPDLERELWRKALVNAAINPVTALHRTPNGALAAGPLHDEALTLLREAVVAAGAAGVRFSEAEAVADFERVVRATAQNHSSMLQDVERGRPTEIDAISGEIVRAAAAHAIDLPATRAVVERLRGSAGHRPAPAQPS
jgi:2-dehydropantoate 2-reductase